MSNTEPAATGGKEDVHSFPLLSRTAADNLLQLDELEITLLTSGDSPKTLTSPPKSSPGHHRATLLLDGLSCSSTSTPGGSFDGTSAQATPTASGGAEQAAAASMSEVTDVPGACLSTAGVLQAHAVAGGSLPGGPLCPVQLQHTAPSSCLKDDSNVDISTTSRINSQGEEHTATSQQQQALQLQQVHPNPSTAAALATSTGGATSSSSSSSCPATLQLPDFAAFLLPEECAFAESSIDDAMMTPTPHTPVVPSIFIGDGLPVVSARTCRPHYSSNGSSDGSSCSSSTGGTAAAAAAGSSNLGSATMQQHGSPKCLLIDNGDDEFELDPFPAAVACSPSAGAAHGGAGGNPAGTSFHQHYAGFELLESDGWDPPAFPSLLCRRTLSTVSEAPNEGDADDSDAYSCTPANSSAGACLLQQQVPALVGSWWGSRQQRQQPVQQKEAPAADSTCVSPKGAPSSSSSMEGACSLVGQPHQGQEHPQQLAEQPKQQQEVEVGTQDVSLQLPEHQHTVTLEGSAVAPTAAAALDPDGVVVEWCADPGTDTPHNHQQQQQQPLAQEQLGVSCSAATHAQQAQHAAAQQQSLEKQHGTQQQQQQGQQGRGQTAAEEISASTVGQGLGGDVTGQVCGSGDVSETQVCHHTEQQGCDATEEAAAVAAVAVAVACPAQDITDSKMAVAGGSSSSAKVVNVTATAVTSTGEDVWEAATRQHLQHLQQHQQATPLLTYAAAETHLLAAAAVAAAGTSSVPRAHTVPGVLRQQRQQCSWRVPWLQRLFICGCSRSSSQDGCRQQRELVLQLAGTAFCDDDPVHLALLQAVHHAFTGQASPVGRYGPHWAALGFQGDDPATDLRGAGVLGLLQLLYLQQHDAAAAGRLYSLSHSSSQEFPLAIVSLNVTTWALRALRAGKLDKAARQLGGHMAAANHFYCGALLEFHTRWVCGNKTMADSGLVLRALEHYCSTRTRQMLQLAAAATATDSRSHTFKGYQAM